MHPQARMSFQTPWDVAPYAGRCVGDGVRQPSVHIPAQPLGGSGLGIAPLGASVFYLSSGEERLTA